jgi:hypothetical protein
MSDSNQRHAVRVPKMLEIEYSADCPPIQTRMQDLSETGLFLESHFPLAVGTVIDLRFELPDGNPEPIVSRARVCNVDPMVGLGVEFVDMPPAVRQRLRMYVASIYFGMDD